MSVWITTLGQVRVLVDGRERRSLPQQRLRCALLIYVAAERDVSRESLIGVFWPDKEAGKALHTLSQHIYELRRALGEEALVASADRVQAGNGLETDVRLFEAQVAAGDHASAIATYGGGFLEGFPLAGSNALELWVDRRRAHLSRLHRRARREQIQALVASGQAHAALDAARAWAEREPLEDEAQHACLELLLRAGARAEARARFEQYEQQLRRELDVGPLDDTVALFTKTLEPLSIDPPAVVQVASPPAEHDAPLPRPDPAEPAVQPVLSGQTTPPGLHGRAFGWRHALIAAGLVAVAIAVVAAWGKLNEPKPQALALSFDLSGHDPSRIAVLYFEDQSEGGDLGHIANGLTETLINELNEVDALSVASPYGVKQFVGKAPTPAEIASTLQVGSIVTGSLQRSVDQLRVAVNLSDATGRQLKSVTLTRPQVELFELYDEMSHEVSRFLRERLGREIELRRRMLEATNVQAWLLVRMAVEQAEEVWRRETMFAPTEIAAAQAALRSADAQLARAEQLDPNWSEPTLLRGWAALGRARAVGSGELDSYNRSLDDGLVLADRVLAKDERHARALELRGTLFFHRARANRKSEIAAESMIAAERDLQEAVNLDSKLAGAWNTLSRLQQYAGKPAAAQFAVLRARNADAYLIKDADIRQRLWRIAVDLQQFDDARNTCAQAHRDYPEEWRFIDCQLSIAAVGPDPISVDSAGRLVWRARELDRHGAGDPAYRNTYRRVQLAVIMARSGRVAEARDSLESLRRVVQGDVNQRASFGFEEAYLCLLVGDSTGAIDALSRYLAENPQYRSYVGGSFVFDGLRNDPRFRVLTGLNDS